MARVLGILTVDCHLKIWNNEQDHKSVHVFSVLGCANHKNRHCVHYTYTLLSFSLYNSYFQYSYKFYKEKTSGPHVYIHEIMYVYMIRRVIINISITRDMVSHIRGRHYCISIYYNVYIIIIIIIY